MRVSSSYEHALQAAYYDIGNRGICVSAPRIEEAKKIVQAEIARNLEIASRQWGIKVFIGAANRPTDDLGISIGDATLFAINLNSSQGEKSLVNSLKTLGYEVPKITKKSEEGEYEQTHSAGELALQKMLSKNQFNYPGGDPAVKAILKVRELAKLSSSYLNARLLKRDGQEYFLTNYNVAGTTTGRRSSRRHTFGFGNNAQNFPKHSDVAQLVRRCLIARPGNILLMVDQISAEDWPVSALAENYTALRELADTTDPYGRHTRLASNIFNIPLASRTSVQWKDSIERYLGKKTRHAHNYDMRANRMSDALAQEGYSYSEASCKVLLDAIDRFEPGIKSIFHKYVRDTLSRNRVLITPMPFGRERQFLSLRPNDANSSAFKEAYSFIPQSTVGDNTGFSVLKLETEYPPEERFIIQEGHDSIVSDIQETPEVIYKHLLRISNAFNRLIKFHNGIEINIPIEAELGFDFQETVKIKEFTRRGVQDALEKIREKRDKNAQSTLTSVA